MEQNQTNKTSIITIEFKILSVAFALSVITYLISHQLGILLILTMLPAFTIWFMVKQHKRWDHEGVMTIDNLYHDPNTAVSTLD